MLVIQGVDKNACKIACKNQVFHLKFYKHFTSKNFLQAKLLVKIDFYKNFYKQKFPILVKQA
jgi:hypothetical protein